MKELPRTICQCIMMIVATKMNKSMSRLTWDDVERIYASGDYPEINAEIDYIVG